MNTSIKQQIYTELEKKDFPDLKFLYSPEALNVSLEILEELLSEEEKDFEQKLLLSNENISFDIFREFSKLDYYFGILEHYLGVHSDETIRNIVETFEPKLVAFSNEIAYSKRYYEMMKYCYENNSLNSEQKRILEKSLKAFEVRGISLPEEKQSRLKEISLRLSELSQSFGNNVVDSKKKFSYLIEDEEKISQMPKDDKQAAKRRAEEKKQKGYLFDASHNSYMSIMRYCDDREVRKHFYLARQGFASEGKYNNKSIILEILRLRKERAELLGYNNYSELALVFKMAENPEQVIKLFNEIAEKGKVKAKQELQEIIEYFDLRDIQNWDVGYYANKLKKEKYDFDSSVFKEYLEYENIRDGMFEIANRLYGVEMKKIDVSVYDSNIEVYEVYRKGKFLSYFFTDYFYNSLKRPGAWANVLREKYDDYKKIVLNTAAFEKGEHTTLLTFGDMETMFHEFGHALHEMLSVSEYSELSGFHVEHDFVELPSQLMENWCREKDGLDMFAKHYKSCETIPEEMLKKLKTLENFGSGQFVVGQMIYAMLDMKLHTNEVPENEEALDSFVEDIYRQYAVTDMGERYGPHTTFTHIFDGGYSAGYYSYMWAEIIEKEVWKSFKDSGDIFDRNLSKKFLETILSAGTTKKATELFYEYMGRDIEIDAFMQEKGLVT